MPDVQQVPWVFGMVGAVLVAFVGKVLWDKWTESARQKNGYVGKPLYDLEQSHQREAAAELSRDVRELIARYDRDQELRRDQAAAFAQRLDSFREELRRISDRLDLLADRLKKVERLLAERRVDQPPEGKHP